MAKWLDGLNWHGVIGGPDLSRIKYLTHNIHCTNNTNIVITVEINDIKLNASLDS